MTFLDRLASGPPLSPPEAALACGVALFTLSGAFGDLEKRLLSVLRDEFPPLSRVTDAGFDQFIARASSMVTTPGALANPHLFIQQNITPAVPAQADRLAMYRFAYALAMSNLNVDSGEQMLLDALKAEFALDDAATKQVEADVNTVYAPSQRALAALTLGLIVVAADGIVRQEELDDLRASRKLLEPIARLDDTQFNLTYDIGQSVYARFLTDPNNRRIFLYYLIVPRLDTPDIRTQAFRYAASIATSDSDIARAEIDTLKDILTALQMNDDAGEGIFNEYMSRVKTIDGQPAPQQPR